MSSSRYDPFIPELALGYARAGGYQAALGLANRTIAKDALKPWLFAESRTGLIRSLTSAQVVDEFGDELAALNKGKPVTAGILGKGSWFKARVGLKKNERLAQEFGTPGFKGLDLGRKGLIVHRPRTGKP